MTFGVACRTLIMTTEFFDFIGRLEKEKKNCRSNVKFDGIYQGEFRLNGHVIDMQSSKDEIDVVISGENIFR